MKRTPKNYDGILSPMKTISQLLPEWANQFQRGKKEAFSDLLHAWPEIIGPKMAKWTEAVSFVDEVLTVIVKSSTLYSVLCQHEKPQLLAKIKERFPNITVKTIVFRVG
jgi:predicted nucleic acid-binding Zn ribbon protein